MSQTETTFFGLRGSRLNWLVICVAGLEFLLFGYDQGVMGGLLTLPSFTKTFPEICTTRACFEGMSESERSTASTNQGISVASYNVGCFFGAALAAIFGDLMGRRRAIFVGCSLVSVGAVLQCTAFHLPHFIAGRVVCGFGTGLNTATVPVWQAECLQPHRRGPVMAFQASLVLAGVMVSYWLDFGLSYAEPSQAAWRFPIAFQLVFAFIIITTIMYLPESPRWLMLKDRQEEAAETISALYNLPGSDPLISDQLSAIYTSIHVDSDKTLMAMFSQGQLKKRTRTFIAVAVQVLSQLSGINIITYYAAAIYENEIGLTPFLSRILAACNGTQYFLASIFSIPLIKYFGRRPLLLFSTTGMCGSMVVLAICTKIGGQQAGIGAATFLFVFNTFFGLAYAQISWLLAAEVVALPVRAQANALATCSNWISNFLIVMITPVAFNNIGWRTYLIFAAFNFAGLPIIYVFFPETWNRSLEEIDLIFTGSKNIIDAVSRSKTMERHFDKKGNLIKGLAADVEKSTGKVDDANDANNIAEVHHMESEKTT